MDLSDLKNTWNKLSADRELNENQLKEMLSHRTKNVIERIERNIKTGFVILFLFFVLIALDDYIVSPEMVGGIDAATPDWLKFLSAFSNALLFTIFIYFVIKYYRVKRNCDVTCNLKDTLQKTINILSLYRRLFYLALFSLTVTMAMGFIAGLYNGSVGKPGMEGIGFSDIQIDQLLLEIVVLLVFLVVVVGGIFILMRWGFNRLYGNYCNKLKQTLKELNEIDD